MESIKFILFSAILSIITHSSLGSDSNSWSAYSDTSSFRDVLQGRSYEEAFGDPYDSLFSSSLTGGYSDGGGSGSSSSYAPQERSSIRVIQPRSDSDYSAPTTSQRYTSPAVTVRNGLRSNIRTSYGSSGQSSYGSKQTPSPQVTKTRKTDKVGYSGGSKTSTSTKATQQQFDSDYDSSDGFSVIPETGFQCLNRYYGYYADVSAGCQIFHVCQPDGRKWSFWCPQGTVYHQKVQTCDWDYNVDCPSSPDYYFLNERIGVLPPQDATLHRF